MKLTKAEQLVLDIIAGAEPFTKLYYRRGYQSTNKRTIRASKAIQSLKDKGLIYKSEGDHILYIV